MENIYNYTKFTNVSRVKYAVNPLYLKGNIADSTAVHRKPRKKYRPVCRKTQYLELFRISLKKLFIFSYEYLYA